MLDIIERYGRLKWKRVAALLSEEYGISSKNHKQCRERWANHLNPSLKKREWTAEEEHLLFFYQRIFGNKWSKIREFLPQRPENSIKNHFYSTLKKKIKLLNKTNPEQQISEDFHQVQTNPDLVEFLVYYQPDKKSKPDFTHKPIRNPTQSTAVQTEDFHGFSKICETENLSGFYWQNNSPAYSHLWPHFYTSYHNSS